MAWTGSKVFRSFISDVLADTLPAKLASGGDVFKVALYDDTITPDQDVASTAAAYGAGVWTTAGGPASGGAQRFEGTSPSGEWWQGGMVLSAQVLSPKDSGPTASPGVVFWDAVDTASGSAADLSGVAGCLVYDDTITASPVADRGVCYNSFGGSNSVVNGTFTVIWSANGILRATLS